MKYTVSQRRAIDSDAKEIVCIAGPGSGKTQTTIGRIKRLIDSGVDPAKIVAITFTNAGADELNSRIICQTQHGPDCSVPEFRHLGFCGTLHGFALKMLKSFGGGIGYGDRLAIVGEEAAADLLASKAHTLGCKLRLEELMKLKTGSLPPGRLSIPQLVIRGYYEDLRDAGMVDFDTILTEFLRLCLTPMAWPDYTHLFVDEVQDSAEIDWSIYEALPMTNKFYVGDPDQAIYSFRGGRVDLLMKKAESLAGHGLIYLQENFRSHLEICQASDRLIAHNKGRLPKHSISVLGEGGIVGQVATAQNEGHEIGNVATMLQRLDTDGKSVWETNEIAVLARTNAICHEYRRQLKAAGIPVAEPAKSNFPFDWGLAKALIELLVNPDNDTLAFFYLLAGKLAKNVPVGIARKEGQEAFMGARRSGKHLNDVLWKFKSVFTLDDVGAALTDEGICAETHRLIAQKIKRLGASADILQLALAMGQPDTEPAEATAGVTVSTIHGAKGREWDVVFIVGFEDEIIPGRCGQYKSQSDTLDQPIEEERRLAFVAVSRARKAVYIAHAGQRQTPWGKIEGHTPSRFIREMLDS